MCARSDTSTGSDTGGIDAVCVALARSLAYRFLAGSLRSPAAPAVEDAVGGVAALREALDELLPGLCGTLVDGLEAALAAAGPGDLESEQVRLFGHAVRGRVPCYETEYGATAHGLMQAHELADLAAFYRVAGLRPRAGERVDHVALECELMQYLARKEAHGLENGDAPQVEGIRDLQREFLESHLGCWGPPWMRRLGEEDGLLAALGRVGERFLEAECRRFDLPIPDAPLALRVPIMEQDEAMECARGPGRLPGMEV